MDYYRNQQQQQQQQNWQQSQQPSDRKYQQQQPQQQQQYSQNPNYLQPNTSQKQSHYQYLNQNSQLDQSHMTNNPHNQSYYNSSYTCEEHPGEPIVNYCSNLECLKELCPECIIHHYKQHQIEGTIPEIETIKQVRTNCSKKLKAAIVSLTNEMEKTEMQYLTNPEVIIEEGVQRLERCKERVIQQVLGYFDQLEQRFKKNVHENMLKANDFQPVFEKIKSLIQELEILNNQLDVGNSVQVIRKICLLDLKSLMEKFQKDIHKVIDTKDLDPILIEIDDSKSYTIQQELQKMAKMVQKASDYNKLDQQAQYFERQQNTFGNINNKAPNQRSQPNDHPTPIRINPNAMASSANNYEQNLQTNLTPIPVELEDHFDNSCKMPNLHFFLQEDSASKFYIWNIYETNHVEFQSVNLAENQFIPTFHKSISLPNGDIYLIGGRNMDGNKSNEIFRYDMHQKKLSLVSHLIHPRSSHAIAYLNGKIYICGGYTSTPEKKSQITPSVEEFDPQTNTVREVQSLNHAAVSLCLTSFNNRYLFKFGGMAEGRQMSLYIEKYDSQFDTWTVIDPKIPLQKFQFLSTGCCQQINSRQIMVFGGYNQDSFSSRQSFIFEVDEKQDGNCSIHSINYKPLPFAEGFWNNNAVVHGNNLYALQNVASENMVDCIQNERRILKYNGVEWVPLN